MTSIEEIFKRIENRTTEGLIELRNAKISDEQIVLLTEKLNGADIGWLLLNGSTISEKGHLSIAKMLEKDKRLRRVELEKTNLSLRALTAYADALKTNTYLTQLVLEDNNLGPHAGKVLAELLEKSTTLRSLDIENNNMRPEAGKMLIAVLERNTRLEYLGDEGNNFKPEDHSTIRKITKRNKNFNEIQVLLAKLDIIAIKTEAFGELYFYIKNRIEDFIQNEYAPEVLTKQLQNKLAKYNIYASPLILSGSRASTGDKGDSKETEPTNAPRNVIMGCSLEL